MTSIRSLWFADHSSWNPVSIPPCTEHNLVTTFVPWVPLGTIIGTLPRHWRSNIIIWVIIVVEAEDMRFRVRLRLPRKLKRIILTAWCTMRAIRAGAWRGLRCCCHRNAKLNINSWLTQEVMRTAGLAIEVAIHEIWVITLRDLALNLGLGKYVQGS